MVNSVINIHSNPNVSFGINGMVEQRCINGYLSVISQDGSARQVINENGGGVSCK
jgi:hypothetical protein